MITGVLLILKSVALRSNWLYKGLDLKFYITLE